MAELKYYQAITQALREEMQRDARVILLGEDVGSIGGIFAHTRGLYEEFGPQRVIDTPDSEDGFVGVAVGAAATGLRPVVDLSFSEFIAVAMDQIVNQAAKMLYMSGGRIKMPLTIYAFVGAGTGAGPQHSQSWESWFIHVPGLKVVMPATAYDLKGVLKAAIRDDNPVMVLIHKAIFRFKSPVPEGEYLIPLGKGDIKRPGKDVTVIATSQMVRRALSAGEKLAADGIEAEVLDPITLSPLDMELIATSVKKTHRVVIVHEAPKNGGVGAEISARITEELFDYLDAPPVRLAAPFVPVPSCSTLEKLYLPDEDRIIQAVKNLLG